MKLKWAPSRAAEYNSLLASELTPMTFDEPANVESLLSQLVSSVIRAATTLEMTTRVGSRRQTGASRQLWFDRECRTHRTTLRRTLREARKNNFSDSTRSTYLATKKSYQTLLRVKSENHEQTLRDKFAAVRNTRDFWLAYKSSKPRKFIAPCIDIPGWEDFYGTIFPPRSSSGQTFCGPYDPFMDRPITEEEVIAALKRCKTGNAPGPDGIPPEFLKNLTPPWVQQLTVLFNAILEAESIPSDWCHAMMTMLDKKGDKADPRNYRGIAILS